MKRLSKLLALLLAVVMVVTMLPVMASADETPAETVETVPETVEQAQETVDEAEQASPAVETPSEAEKAPAEETKAEEAPAEETKAEEAPAEIKAEEPPVEIKTEETPAAEAPKVEEAALETAEKTEKTVETTAEDAYWSYTSVGGTTTYYMELVGDDGAVNLGLLQDSAATNETAGVLTMLKDYEITESGKTINNETISTGSSLGVLYNLQKAVNIDLNGHTLTNNHVHTSGSTYFFYYTSSSTGSTAPSDIYISVTSSVAGGKYVQPETSLANKRGMIGIGQGSMAMGYTVHITLDNIIADSGDSPIVNSVCQHTYLTIKDCDLTVENTTPVIKLSVSTAQTTSADFSQTAVFENSHFRLGSASNSVSVYWYDYTGNKKDGYHFSDHPTRSLTIKGEVTMDVSTTYSNYAKTYHGMYNYIGNGTGTRTQIDWMTWAQAENGYVLSCDDGVVDGNIQTFTASTTPDSNPCVIFDLGDNPASIDPQFVAENGHPTDVEVPMFEKNGTYYEFAYWTVEGDEAHYANASDYTVTEDVTLCANYVVTVPYFSYTTVGGDTAYYMTLDEALVASQADDEATTTEGGVIALLRDVSTSENGGPEDWPGSSFIYVASGQPSSNAANPNQRRYTKAITIDLAGHTLTHDIANDHFIFIAATNSGAPVDLAVTLTSSITGGRFVNMGKNVAMLGQSAASFVNNGARNANTVVIENLTIEHRTTYNMVTSYLHRSHVVFRNDTIIATNIGDSCIVAMQLSYGAINGTSGKGYVWNDNGEIGYRTGITATDPFDYTVTFEDCEIVTGRRVAFFADYFYQYTSTTYPLMTNIHKITPPNPYEAELNFIGTNTLYNSQSYTGAPYQYCKVYGTSLNLLDSEYVHADDPDELVGITESLNDQTYTFTPAGGEETTLTDLHKITLGTGESCDVNWYDADDALIQSDTLMVGSIATPPEYTGELKWYEKVLGWGTDENPTTPVTDFTVNADTNFHAIVGEAYPDTRTAEPAGVSVDGETERFTPTLTEALTLAKGRTATVKLYADVTFSTETEPGDHSGWLYTWYALRAGTDLTLDLNGHTLSGGTDETPVASGNANGCMDRSLINFDTVAGADQALTIKNGVLVTNGKRQTIQLGSTSNTALSGVVSFTAVDVTFRTTNTTTSVIFQPQLLSATATPTMLFTNCFFDNQTEGHTILTVCSPYSNANTSPKPWSFTFNNCTYNNFENLYFYTKNETSSAAFVAPPQVTIDAATAAHIVNAHSGVVSTRTQLDAASYDPSIETYVVDPWADGAVFNLAGVSMSLRDYVYVNVMPNESWTGDYKITTSLTNEAISANGTAQVTNLAISAKDMGTEFVVTIFADADATTRYLSGTFGSIDSFATLTSESDPANAQLVAAMDAMQTYGDWAAYNFGTSTTAPAAIDAFDATGITPSMEVTGRANTTAGTSGYFGTSAVLGGQLYLKHYFYHVSDLSSSNTSTTAPNVEFGKDASGKFGWVKVKIAPKDYKQAYAVSVTDGGSTYSVTGSMAQYAVALTAQGATEMEKTLATALLHYCEAAKTYFDSLS